jgi:hypothetical protein
MSFSVKVTAGAVVLLAAAILFVLWSGSGHRATVERRIREVFEEARAHRAEACVAFLSPSFRSDTTTYEEACALIREHVSGTGYFDLRLTRLEVEAAGDTATAEIRFDLVPSATSGLSASGIPRRLRLQLSLASKEWKITSAEYSSPLDR